jgi:uncharacterized OB-fold protein
MASGELEGQTGVMNALAHDIGVLPAYAERVDWQVGTVDLTERTAEVVTWSESVATPSGVRTPNTLAFVAFSVESSTVRVLGQTTNDVAIGDTVRPVPVDRLRDPEESLREAASQRWSGYRFDPVE